MAREWPSPSSFDGSDNGADFAGRDMLRPRMVFSACAEACFGLAASRPRSLHRVGPVVRLDCSLAAQVGLGGATVTLPYSRA